VILDCALYEDGRRRAGPLPLDSVQEASREEPGFVWLGMHEPTAAEFDAVRREFALHDLAVEDALTAHQRPKLELYDETLLVVIKTAHYVDSDEVVETGQILLFVNPGFVVSVRYGDASPLTPVRRALEERPEQLRLGPAAVLHAVLDRVVDDYAPVVEGVEVDLQEAEAQVFSASRRSPTERIYKLQREVIEFHRAVAPLVGIVDRLARGQHPLVAEELRPYFRDVYDHVAHVVQAVEQFRELLSTMLQAALTQVTVRQNEDMRRISSWVAILAVPTMVAGIYGMNFEHMPELKWRYGYPTVLVVIALVCGGLYVRLRRAGWL
jgi:magnesium transporter